MTGTVLVPLDGSNKDERALPLAAAFADLADAPLHLVRVLATPIDTLSIRAGLLGITDASRELRDKTARSLAATAEELATTAHRTVTCEVIDGADVATVLLAHATAHGARLIVMGTRAASVVGRALGGSVADRVMRESPLPVVLAPPGATYRPGEQVQLRRVLVPLDESPAARRAIDQLLALVPAKRLELVLLEVVPPARAVARVMNAPPMLLAGLEAPGPPAELPDPGDVRAEAEARLEAVAAELRARGLTVETQVVEAGHPDAAITGVVRELLVDLIVMSTRGTSGIRRMVLGSVAHGVVRHSEVPVLLVTPDERAASTGAV